MSLDSIKTHMNNHHVAELCVLVKVYGGFETTSATLVDVNEDGMTIEAGGKSVFAPFKEKTQEADYKNAIIGLCMSAAKMSGASASGDDSKKGDLKQEIEAFKDEFQTILLSSLSSDKTPHISYSPLLRYEGNYFLYISDVAAHTANLRANPDCAQAMFIEDESKAKVLLARKRLTYDISVTFLPRDDFFNKVYDSFEARVGKGGGVAQVREMLDFHLVKIEFKKGRFVKGFGQAYEIDGEGNIGHIGGGSKGGMPHSMPPHAMPHGHGHN